MIVHCFRVLALPHIGYTGFHRLCPVWFAAAASHVLLTEHGPGSLPDSLKFSPCYSKGACSWFGCLVSAESRLQYCFREVTAHGYQQILLDTLYPCCHENSG